MMNALLEWYQESKENALWNTSDNLQCWDNIGNTADKWLVLLKSCLQIEDGLAKKKLLKHFFHQAKQHIDTDKNKHDINFAKLLANEAMFIAEQNTDDCITAFRGAGLTCRRVPYIHVAFAQFQVNNGRHDKALKILETAKLFLPLGTMVDIAIGKLKDGCDDLGLKNDSIFKNYSNESVSQTKMAKLEEVTLGTKRTCLTDTSVRSPLRPVQLSRRLDALDIPPSPRTPAIPTPNKLLPKTTPNVPKMHNFFNTNIELKTPSPPKLTQSVKKSKELAVPSSLVSSGTKSITTSWTFVKPDGVNKRITRKTMKPQRVPCSLQKTEQPDENLNSMSSCLGAQSFEVKKNESSMSECLSGLDLLSNKHLNSSEEPCFGSQQKNASDMKKDKKNSSYSIDVSVSKNPNYQEQKCTVGQHCENTVLPAPCKLSSQERLDYDPYYRLKEMDMLHVQCKPYLLLKLLGEGGSSKVYEALDIQERTLKAIKRVHLQDCDETVKQGFLDEVKFLEKFPNNPSIVHLYNYEHTNDDLLLVMECGSTDLSKWIKRNAKKLKPYEVKYYWMKMLAAVRTIHEHGVIHRDLKPANFLIVKGNLKLIDFGIANSIQADATSVIKDTQFGTLNYMAPETILDISGSFDTSTPQFKISPQSDVWSLGCILYLMMYGKTPFQHVTHQAMKLAAITNANHKINFPDYEERSFVEIVQACLVRDPKKRPTIKNLIDYS